MEHVPLVGPEGLEPSRCRLKAGHSAAELQARVDYAARFASAAPAPV